MEKTESTLIHFDCRYCGDAWCVDAVDVMWNGSQEDIDHTIEDAESITHVVVVDATCEACDMDFEDDDEYWDDDEDWEEIMEWEQMQQEIGY